MIYTLNMSKGQNIKIDEEDLQKVKQNISANLIVVKQAIINPAFLISITPLEEEDFEIKPKIIIEDGVAKIIAQDRIPKLENLMQDGNTKKLST